MFRNYLKIAVRKLFGSNRPGSSLYNWINLVGLTIGLTAFLLIGHYVHYELGYDRNYPNHENIYRLVVERVESGEVTMRSAKTYAGAGHILKEEMPEVNQFVRILYEECMFQYEPENIILNRQRTFWADGNFQKFFGLDMLLKGQSELLHKPNHAIISRSAAERFFGPDWEREQAPLGKTLVLNGGVPFIIQGVFDNLPSQSHMKVDFVVSYSTLMALLGDYMDSVMPPQGNFVYNYLAVKEGEESEPLQYQVNRILSAHINEPDDHVNYNFSLQSLTSIHLNSHLSDELNPNGSKLLVLALSMAAILILVVAWINFINLSVARAMNRTKEVGVRKIIGARKREVALQFIVETLIAGIVALIITIAVLLAGSNTFNRILGIDIPMFSTTNLRLWLVFIIVFVAGAILASIYPALILSSVKPASALKGKQILSIGKSSFRKGLMLFQFITAMLLVACTGAVYYQISYMRQQSLGVDLEQVLVIHSPRTMIGNEQRVQYFKQFREGLNLNTDIISVASGECLPGEEFLIHTENVHAEGIETEVDWTFDVASVDENYIPVLGLEMAAGRNFDERPGENNKVILNETAVRAIGFQNPDQAIDRYIRINGNERYQIAGVVRDSHFRGLRESIKPMLLKYGHNYEFGFFPIKIRADKISQTISAIESKWKATYTKDPFEFFFLDEFFESQYKNDLIFGRIFAVFSGLILVIAGLGLFGLISFNTYKRSREIGIRKIMGANILSIIMLLTSGILNLILVASLVALPLAGFIINKWLNTFAYRFDPELWMYSIPVFLLLIISMLAVGGQTLRAALSNPVDAIAEE